MQYLCNGLANIDFETKWWDNIVLLGVVLGELSNYLGSESIFFKTVVRNSINILLRLDIVKN